MIPRAEFWLPRLTPQRWLRGPANLVNGAIQLDRAAAELYEPADGPQVLLDLLDVESEQDMSGFVARHGLLMSGPDDRVLRETWQEWQAVRSALLVTLRVARASREAASGNSVAAVGFAGLLAQYAADPTFRTEIGSLSHHDQGFPDQLAKFASAALTGGMVGARLAIVSSDAPGGYSFTVHGDRLLHRIWFEAALSVTGRTLLAECQAPKCGRVFERDDPRRKYCSTRCGNRVHQRDRTRRLQAL